MATLFITHPDCIAHDPGAGHPESPARLRAVLAALEEPQFRTLIRREAPLGRKSDAARVHGERFVEAVLASVPESGRAALDPDTILSKGSGQAALRAIGAITSAVDAVLAGDANNAFCAVRPPGHHAEPDRPMGFCLFNSIAIAARHAQAVGGLERVAIVDFDVHHGNGTQAVAENDSTLFFASSHQFPLYPGTGAADETGVGNIVNAPLPAGTNGTGFRRVFETGILPALDAFAPELVLVSAGFDAHRADPLAGLELEEPDFAWVTSRLLEAARRHAQGRLVSILEGGYDLKALAGSAAAHVQALMAVN
ncbi:MAG TPA: histone deacetylase family protein [Rhizomicrobium sp.]|nr:histone deacetylase family protein [Rhizomicrobium sp.]